MECNATADKTQQLSDKMDDVLREVEEIDKLSSNSFLKSIFVNSDQRCS